MAARAGIDGLAGALASAASGRRLAVVGAGDGASELRRLRPGPFVAESDAEAADGVLALDAEAATLARAAALAARARGPEVLVLLDRPRHGVTGSWRDAAEERLRAAGLLVAGTRRLVWEEPGEAPPAASLDRESRLDDETRAALVRCVPSSDPRAAAALADRVAALERELEAHREAALAHARTRQAEEFRARRLEDAERRLEEVDAGLLGELERLRAELAELRASRLVRLGGRYWAARDRAARALGRGGRP